MLHHLQQLLFTAFLVLSAFTTGGAGAGEKCSRDDTCYAPYGCFSNRYPFNGIPSPHPPRKMKLKFQFMRLRRGSTVFSTQTGTLRPGASYFSSKKKTVLIIHGFKSSSRASWLKQIATNLLKLRQFNVIGIDWSGGASLFFIQYMKAVSNTRMVGRMLAHKLSKDLNIDFSMVHCIGHSLGAHTCGFMGKYAFQLKKKKLYRISGLDPAGPGFDKASKSRRLDSSDADFVDIIHTDGGETALGLEGQIGHIDFYPNGGDKMPGCFFLSAGCSHTRAPKYYAESIVPANKCVFEGTACDCYEKYKKGKCRSGSKALMGFWSINYRKQADDPEPFYLKTKGRSPYALKC